MPPKLTELSYEDYLAIKKSGMFWEYYPEATGIYYEDVQKVHTAYIPTTTKEELSSMKHQWTEDGLTCKAVVKGNTIKIKAVSGYCQGVDTLLKLTDTGNGFIAKVPSCSFTKQDNYICLGYDEADYLYKALQVWFEEQEKQLRRDIEDNGIDLL